MPVQKSRFTFVAILIVLFTITNITPASAAKKTKKHNTDRNTTMQQMIITSTGAYDGWLLESRETSDMGGTLDKQGPYLYLGDDMDRKQYRSILSFKTNVLPDNATITRAILKIKLHSIIGNGDPVRIMGGFIVDIMTGHFGTYPALQMVDFQIASNGTDGPMSPTLSSYKIYNLNLEYIQNFINKIGRDGGVTQIRLGFNIDDNNNRFANILQIYSGDAPIAKNRPQLVIHYTTP